MRHFLPKNFSSLVILHLASVACLSCGEVTTKKHRSREKFHEITLYGNPMSLISSAKLNKNSFLNASDTDLFQGLKIAGIVAFRTSAPKNQNGHDLESFSDNSDKNRSTFPYWYFSQWDEKHYVQTNGNQKLKWKLNNDEFLELVEFSDNAVEMLHYSVNKQKDLFSLLFLTQDTEGPTMWSIHFFKPSKPHFKPNQTDLRFNYLLGAGVKTSWEKDLNLSVCDSPIAKKFAKAILSAQAWEKNGLVGSRPFTLNTIPHSTPFSDVNTSCILLVEDYNYSVNEKSFTSGLTLSSLDQVNQNILSSSILIFTSSIRQFTNQEQFSKILSSTLTHEVGHWLGLGHTSTNAEDLQQPSIMSEVMTHIEAVQTHDLKAIEELYGPYIGSEGTR